MNKEELTVQRILADGSRFQVPPYQRSYQWGNALWFELWQDLAQLFSAPEGSPPHFLGFIITQDCDVAVGEPSLHAIVDGQQRIITLALLDLAISDAIAEFDNSSQSSRPRHRLQFTLNDTVFNTLEVSPQDRGQLQNLISDVGAWRVWYQTRTSVKDLRSNDSLDRLFLCYVYFRRLIALGKNAISLQEEGEVQLVKYSASQGEYEGHPALTAEQVWETQNVENPFTKADLTALRDKLHKRNFVLALYIGDDDEPPVAIYDSVNANKKALMQWDFVRSEIFLTFSDSARAENIVLGDWSIVEDLVNQSTADGVQANPLDIFLYDYLISRGEKQIQGGISRNRTSTMFQARFRRALKGISPGSAKDDKAEEFIDADLMSYAKCWIIAAAAMENHLPDLTNRAVDGILEIPDFKEEEQFHLEALGKLSFAPLHPLAAKLIEYYLVENKGTRPDFLKCLIVLEAYIVRLVLTSSPLSPLRSRITSYFKARNSDNEPIEVTINPLDLFNHLDETGNDNMPIVPDDTRLEEFAMGADYYAKFHAPWLGVIFRGIERNLAGPDHHPLPYGGEEGLTVEHVFPQTPGDEWDEEIGEWLQLDSPSGTTQDLANMIAALSTLSNTLGNLTLIRAETNSAMGNCSFSKKKEVLSGNSQDYPHSIFNISGSLTSRDRWYPEDVTERTSFLISQINNVWSWSRPE